MNAASDAIHSDLAPNRSLAQPVSGITLANASMYAVGTHWIVAIEVWKSRPSVGSATLVIVASRIVMIVPSTTTAASVTISRVSTGASVGRVSGDAMLISGSPRCEG